LIARNARQLNAVETALFDRPWAELRREAHLSALTAARAYLAEHGEPIPEAFNADSLVVAGHQPELFHPGVWVKNFALAGLAARHGVTALNLVVDNDTVKSTALRIPSPPTSAVAWPHAVTVPFDRWTGEIPYEERPVLDRDEFAAFADRAGLVLAGWRYKPLLAEFWRDVLAQYERTKYLGECFARARRARERRWGCHNLEIPVSRLCETSAFDVFACFLLANLPRFHAIYNGCVHDYRRSHGLRSRNHPVPDLAVDGDWLETPFWGWRAGSLRRGRLLARPRRGGVDLRADNEVWPAVSLVERGGAAPTLAAHRADGYRIRSRALTNTLYARLFLGDLFIHGIGGGKYDELTDAIIHKFFAIEPPVFMVLTATRLLPLPRYPATADLCHQLQRSLRDVHWNPQRHLPPASADLRPLIEERKAWTGRRPTDKAGRRERFRAIREISDRLRQPLEGEERRLRTELATCHHQLDANEVLSHRDYSFVLYPEETLRPFCEQFL
jgi:hypothetical protein